MSAITRSASSLLKSANSSIGSHSAAGPAPPASRDVVAEPATPHAASPYPHRPASACRSSGGSDALAFGFGVGIEAVLQPFRHSLAGLPGRGCPTRTSRGGFEGLVLVRHRCASVREAPYPYRIDARHKRPSYGRALAPHRLMRPGHLMMTDGQQLTLDMLGIQLATTVWRVCDDGTASHGSATSAGRYRVGRPSNASVLHLRQLRLRPGVPHGP